MNLRPSAFARFRRSVVCQALTKPPGFKSYSMSRDRCPGLGPSSTLQLPLEPFLSADTPTMPEATVCHRSAAAAFFLVVALAVVAAGASRGCRRHEERPRRPRQPRVFAAGDQSNHFVGGSIDAIHPIA